MVDSAHSKQSENTQNSGIEVVVYDLDNTLIFTDEANNHSYIKVLKHFGYDPSRLHTIARITSKRIQQSYPEMTRFKLWRIKRNKLKVFLDNLHLVRLNDIVAETIEAYKDRVIIIWTSSNRKRALALIKHLNIRNDWMLCTQKGTASAVDRIVSRIEKKYRVNLHQILFYEDDHKVRSLLCGVGALTVAVEPFKTQL
jgi:phosphoglycolate phosphatase-like HAD superfamily hydrolase